MKSGYPIKLYRNIEVGKNNFKNMVYDRENK
jgi:hypothetical protein